MSSNLPGDIAAWLLEGIPVAQLATRGIQLERHAELVEVDPARWQWLHVRDRIAEPRDVWAPLAPLISVLADSPIASRFYTYSSLNRLCFSASSHYPWVGEFPVVYKDRDGRYRVDEVSCTLEEAIARIEAALASSPVEPFFGSAPDYEAQLVTAAVTRCGSKLRPEVLRRGQWSDVWLAQGARRCRMSSTGLTCVGEAGEFSVECSSIEGAVGVALRFLEELATPAEVASDARVVRRDREL